MSLKGAQVLLRRLGHGEAPEGVDPVDYLYEVTDGEHDLRPPPPPKPKTKRKSRKKKAAEGEE